MSAPTVISTFAGCGGSSLGYQWAGYDERLAVEWDDNAVETFRMNFPDVPVYRGDIGKLAVDKALRLAGLRPGELDVLDGSPPCQGFSIAGKRDFGDSRNQLFKEYVRLLQGLRPKVFVMENVSGMVKGKMKIIFAEIMRELKASGYRVKARLLNAMCFGVPQSRERMIFIGVREDLGIEPSHPVGNRKKIPFRDVCSDLRGNGESDRMLPDIVLRVAERQPQKWSTDLKIFKSIKANCASAISLQWTLWDRICGTLVKTETFIAGIVHPDRERYLSLGEYKRL